MQGLIIKENITKFMFDKNNPEMITILKPVEIEKLAIIQSLVMQENQERLKYENLEENILDDILYNIYVLRCSVNGFRSEQGVKIINTHIKQEQANQQNQLNTAQSVTE